jgi:hypothetical protein
MLILNEKTIQKFNYNPDNLASQSHKLVVVACPKCNNEFNISFKSAKINKMCINCFRWTEDDKQYIVENHGKLSNKEMACYLNRTVSSVENFITKFNLGKPDHWSLEEDNLLKEMYPTCDLKDMVLKIGRSASAIKSHAKKFGLQYKTVWKEHEIQILKDNYGKINIYKLHELLPNRTIGSIHAAANSLGIKSTFIYSSYNWNRDFFGNINLMSSYYAGFIAADGYIGGRALSELEIQINSKDKCLLEQFQKDINYNGSIKNSEKYQISRLLLTSTKMCKDLESNYNITTRKTFTLKPPEHLNLKNSLAFIKGLIDGDGCVTISKKNFITIELLGTEAVMEWVRNIVVEIMPNYTTSKVAKIVNIYRYRINGKTAIKFAKKLEKILPDHGLRRKWNKFSPYYTNNGRSSLNPL